MERQKQELGLRIPIGNERLIMFDIMDSNRRYTRLKIDSTLRMITLTVLNPRPIFDFVSRRSTERKSN